MHDTQEGGVRGNRTLVNKSGDDTVSKIFRLSKMARTKARPCLRFVLGTSRASAVDFNSRYRYAG